MALQPRKLNTTFIAAAGAMGEVGSLASVLNDLVHRTFFENPALDA
jgi:hypothetical protein